MVGGGYLESKPSDQLWLSFRLALAKPNNKVFHIQSQMCQLNGKVDYKTDVIQFILQWKSRSSVSSLIILPIIACRFMHNFIVDCRFASLIVDVDFHQKIILDFRF
jgi:hypothetical protein